MTEKLHSQSMAGFSIPSKCYSFGKSQRELDSEGLGNNGASALDG
jgi:hypothetical protein